MTKKLPLKTADNKFKDFLKASTNKLNLKFIFDNLKNFSIAAFVFSVGISSIKNNSFSLDIGYFYNMIIDIFTISAGFSLIVLNISSFLSATTNKKSKIIFFILNVLFILSAIKLFIFLVGSYSAK